MKERVVEILMYIMTEMRQHQSVHEIDLSPLTDRGYTQAEINAALSWLSDALQTEEGGAVSFSESSRNSSVRVLHDVERHALTTEGYGYLIQLRELGLLRESDFEAVIERVMMSGYEKVYLRDLQDIVAAVLASRVSGRNQSARHAFLDDKDTIH